MQPSRAQPLTMLLRKDGLALQQERELLADTTITRAHTAISKVQTPSAACFFQ